MSGLRMICKAYGGLRVSDGRTSAVYVWDYQLDQPVLLSELKQRKADERAAKKAAAERARKQCKQEELEL